MADTLRDLVVSLSLDTTNFTKNMKSINTQIREAETYFKEAGAGIDKYEKTISGLGNKITTLERVERAQTKAVKENEKHVAQVNKKYEEAVVNLKNAKTNLEKVTKQFGENSDEAKKAAEQVNKCENALQNANIAQGQATISLSKANIALKETQVQLAKTRKELDGLKWTNFGDAMEKAGDKMIKAGKAMNRVGKSMTRTITAPLAAIGTFSGKAYIEFEDAMAGVRKTVDATEEKFEELDDSIRQMSLVTPTAAKDIAFVMETAGQLGIATDAIEDFTKKMVDFGNVSNSLDSVTAAETFARYANIRGDAIEQNNDYFNRLTSTVFKLSNTMATTEADVSEMSMALAAAGTQVGMTDAQIVALSASLSSVGVSAQKGGTAFSKVLVKMEAAVAKGVSTNNKALADFSKVAGMTQEEFATLWKTDAGSAFMAFIDGVAKLDEEGVSAITTLQDLGLNEVRLRDTLLRTVNAQELFVKAMASANDEWQTAEYMNEKVEERYASTANQIEILKNNATDLAMSIGEILLPYVNEFLGMARDFIAKLKDMSKEELAGKLKIAAFAAAIGPAVVAIGKLTKGLGFAFKGVGLFATAVGKAGGGISGVGKVLAKSPALWLALAAAVAYATYKIWDYVSGAKAAREALEKLDQTAREWEQDATTAFEKSGGLSAFNLDREAFGLDSFSENANEWLTNLIDVWTDGKKETDEIVNEMVKSWTDGSDKIRQANGITDEDVKRLDEMDTEIESLLKKRQNGYFSEKDKERLQELVDERGSIAIKYHFVEDVESGFDDIVTKVQAAVERQADKGDVFVNGFAAANEALGVYLSDLNKQYDEEYARIKEITDEKERQAELDKLNQWYADKEAGAYDEYYRTLVDINKETDPFGDGGRYDEQIEKLEKVNELMEAAVGGDNQAQADLRNYLSGLSEDEIVEMKAAIEAYKAAYGEDVPQEILDAEKALKDIDNLVFDNFDLFDPETQELLEKMFGGLDQESNEVFAHFNVDSLTASFNAWAEGEHEISGSIDASGSEVTTPPLTMTVTKITDDGLERKNVEIKSIDNMAGTVTYIEDGVEKVATFEELEEMGATVKYIDADGNMVYTTPFKAALAGMQGRIANVTVDDNTIIPEIEVEAKVKKLNFDEGEFTTDNNADLGFKKAEDVLASRIASNVKDFVQKAWEGVSFENLLLDNDMFDVLEGALKTEKKNNYFGIPDWIHSFDGGKWTRMAQYFADGMQKISDGTMDEGERKEFEKNIDVLYELMNMNTPGGKIANSEFGDALKKFGWDDITDFFDQWDIIKGRKIVRKGGGGGAEGESGGGRYAKMAQEVIEDVKKSVEEAAENAEPVEIDPNDLLTIGERSGNGGGSNGKGGGGRKKRSGGGRFTVVGQEVIDDVLKSIDDAADEADPVELEPDDLIDENLEGAFKPEGVNIMNGIIAGVNSRSGALALALIAAVQKAKKAVEDDNKIASPSKVWRDEIGANLAKGIGEGVLQEAPSQGKIIANAARYLTDSAAGAMSGGHSAITGNNTTNNTVSNSVVNHININASVRSDNDIRKLAQQIARLTARVNGGYGMLSQLKKA